MGQKRCELREAFIEDHRRLTRGFSELLRAIQLNDLAAAHRAATELDQRAGPHIRFEESVLYPKVAESRGADFVRRLYEEHRIGADVLRRILAHGPTGALTLEQQSELARQAQTALDHAVSCGALLSHITTLDEAAQAEMLRILRRFQKDKQCWTEFAGNAAPENATK